MKKLTIANDAEKVWKNLDAKQYKQVGTAIMKLLSDSRPHDSSALKGARARRVDAGEYRIIYNDTPDEVSVLVIGKRNDDDVYKTWARR